MTGKIIAIFLALGALTSVAAATVPGPSSKPVDPKKYVGRWYEVARMPNKVQANCAAATSDWARQPDGQFQVIQTCHMGSATGSEKTWRGSGRIVDEVTNSKFRIGFFGGLVQMDYWVLDRGDDYSWCILTTPNPKFLWIMSRRPNLTPAQTTALIERARSMGYDVSKLIFDNPPAG
ncbi:MAG: lipocalin family protein [Caulobacteraceae bacterium]|nr:lipocalin family protein [Caulobacteraceae bacterium]